MSKIVFVEYVQKPKPILSLISSGHNLIRTRLDHHQRRTLVLCADASKMSSYPFSVYWWELWALATEHFFADPMVSSWEVHAGCVPVSECAVPRMEVLLLDRWTVSCLKSTCISGCRSIARSDRIDMP